MQSRNAEVFPLSSQERQVGPLAVGGIEKDPKVTRPKRGNESCVEQSVAEVGEALIAGITGRDSQPQNGAPVRTQGGDERNAAPPVLGEHLGASWKFSGDQTFCMLPDRQ